MSVRLFFLSVCVFKDWFVLLSVLFVVFVGFSVGLFFQRLVCFDLVLSFFLSLLLDFHSYVIHQRCCRCYCCCYLFLVQGISTLLSLFA